MLPQLDIAWYPSQCVWLLLTFFAMFLITWRYVMPLMQATVETRKSRISSDIEMTEKLKAEAEKKLKEIEKSEKVVFSKMQTLLAQAQTEAEENIKQLDKTFNDKLANHTAQKEAIVEQAKADALKEITKISTELASMISMKVSGISLNSDDLSSHTETVEK